MLARVISFYLIFSSLSHRKSTQRAFLNVVDIPSLSFRLNEFVTSLVTSKGFRTIASHIIFKYGNIRGRVLTLVIFDNQLYATLIFAILSAIHIIFIIIENYSCVEIV